MTKAIINHDRICMKCLKNSESLNIYSLYGRGYGSDYDNFNSKVQLCGECDYPILAKWFTMDIVIDSSTGEYDEYYPYEDDITNFIKSLPLESQELFENRFAYGACAEPIMDAQDWIDMQLGILSDEKHEEYGFYSPRQIKAYEERFTTCEHPVNIYYNENSKSCKCPFGAFGGYNQTVGLNIADECFKCEHYKTRESPIRELDNKDYDKYKDYIKGSIYKDLFE